MTNKITLQELNKINLQKLNLCPTLLQKVGHKGRTTLKNVLPLKNLVFKRKNRINIIFKKIISLKNVLPCFDEYLINKCCFY